MYDTGPSSKMFHVKHFLYSSIIISGPESMEHFVSQCCDILMKQSCIHLHGPLGAGKTTFMRYLLRYLGYTGIVKSPTYALVESYVLKNHSIDHCDFYRLHSPIDLNEFKSSDHSIMFIEWPTSDLEADGLIFFSYTDTDRENERKIDFYMKKT